MFGKNKKANYFYDCFYNLGLISMECYETLSSGMKTFTPTMDLLKFKNEVHIIEHKGDEQKEIYEEQLAKEFITPIDREDIFLLLDAIDDLTDAIDEISYKMYLRNYRALPPKTDLFIDETHKCMEHMLNVLKNINHISDKEILYPLIQIVKEDEQNMDRLYETEVHNLYVTGNAYDKSRFDERIYAYFENITDKCRDICKEIIIIMYKSL